MIVETQEKLNQVKSLLTSTKAPCLLSFNSRNNSGYATSTRKNVTKGDHVWAYIDNYGEVPYGQCVLHTCDKPHCIEPSHLFLGTRSDNMRDMHGKKRGKNQKLSEEDVLAIRQMYKDGCTYEQIAWDFDIKWRHAWDVVNRRIWKHI